MTPFPVNFNKICRQKYIAIELQLQLLTAARIGQYRVMQQLKERLVYMICLICQPGIVKDQIAHVF